MDCCAIFDTFDVKNTLLREYQHWKLAARNRNTTLGNCIAITKRHIEKFSDISEEEMTEFARVVKDIENALTKAFSCDRVNYLILMMVDNHVHVHIIPRYAAPRPFAGAEWVDEGWPKQPATQKAAVAKEVLQKVRQEIKKFL